MEVKQIGPVLKAWYRWKSLRLPWRKQFLVGLDLRGNTYWEFRLTRGGGPDDPYRRIVRYPRSAHLSEVAVPPAWHQWLRHLRAAPPTLEEQRADVARRQRVRALAAEADRRWEAKASLLAHPGRGDEDEARKGREEVEEEGEDRGRRGGERGKQQPVSPSSAGRRQQPQDQAAAAAAEEQEGVRGGLVDESPAESHAKRRAEAREKKTTKKKEEAAAPDARGDPWKSADARRGGPSETWQPEAWDPSASSRGRR